MKTTGHSADYRVLLAADILKGWTLAEIQEHGGSGTTESVVALALNLADSLYRQARERGWMGDAG